MPLKLRLAKVVGDHAWLTFRARNGTIYRVPCEPDDVKFLNSAKQEHEWGFVTHSGKSVRPAPTAKIVKGEIGWKFDTPDGFLAPGDYIELDTGELMIQRERPNPSVIVVTLLDRGEWTGTPSDTESLKANRMIGPERIVLDKGFLR